MDSVGGFLLGYKQGGGRGRRRCSAGPTRHWKKDRVPAVSEWKEKRARPVLGCARLMGRRAACAGGGSAGLRPSYSREVFLFFSFLVSFPKHFPNRNLECR